MKKILLFLLLFSLKQINSQVTFCFASPLSYPSVSTPLSICNADFNNDGFMDMASANYNGNNVDVYINTGSGTFSPPVPYAAGNGAQSVVSADFNGDGNKDLVVANYNAGTFSILLGSATGTFGAQVPFGTGSNPTSITTGDWNGDGKADVAVCNETSANVSIRLGNGLGSFGTQTTVICGGSPEFIINADINNDTKKDLIIACSAPNLVFVLMGNGLGGFSTPGNFSVGSTPVCVTSGDFNGDGNIDVASANQTGNVSVLIGNGAGSFAAAVNYPASGTPQAVTTGDYNNDGKLDLAVGTNLGISVLAGTGTGTFGSPNSFPASGTAVSIESADFNNDGKTDISATTSPGNLAVVLLNTIPSVSITGSTTVCYFQNTLLTASGATNYTWSPSALTTNTINYSNCCTNTVSVVGTNTGCAIPSTKIVTITVNPLPTITFTASPTNICFGKTSTLTAGGANTYTWTTGPTTIATTSSIAVTPTVSGTINYNITGTSAAGCVSLPSTFTLGVFPKPTVTVNNATICSGIPTILTGGGANTYSWSTTATTSTISVSPTSNTNYTVIGTDINTCTNIAVSTVSVNASPTVTGVASPTAVCSGSLLTLNGAGASTYTWSGGITNNVAFTATATQVYTVTGTNSNGCIKSGTISVTMMTNPTLTITGKNLICLNNPQILTASGASTYTWLPSSTFGSTVSATPTVNTTYTATGIAANGCRNATTFAITLVQPPTPDICQVTVDSLGFNNEIYWEKSLYPSADSFIVYREVSTNIYKRIAAQHKSVYSMYTDTNRTIGPANGNPNLTYYKYKIQLRDSCGNLSAMSLWHETIFVQDQLNGNFNWNMYAIELSVAPVANYNLKRRDVATGTETLIVSTTGGLANDPAYNSFWPLNVKWFVDAVGFNCAPTAKLDPNSIYVIKTKTKSNQSNDKLVLGINSSVLANNVRVYPNPASDVINIDLNGLDKTETTVEIQNTLGQIIYQTKALNQYLVVNTADFGSGVYMVNIKQNNKTIAVKKVVVDK